jgi:hypothetical protein
MPDPKDSSFFRKVVRFVANPATDWTDLSRPDGLRDGELEKGELKAMIERKRRNDFVRKREFDMLRRVRREGLSGEQLAALGRSSRIDDSEARLDTQARPDGVKAKIDAIEQQMVGDGLRRPPAFFAADTQPPAVNPMATTMPAALHRPAGHRAPPPLLDEEEELPALPPLPDPDEPVPVIVPPMVRPLSSATASAGLAPPVGAPVPVAPAAPRSTGDGIEVSEVVHDPELDEAVIAFANADFGACEHALLGLTQGDGPRLQHPDTWLVLFDLYRATGQQNKFEGLALDFAQRFGRSSPQWYSLPRLVAEAAASAAAQERPGRLPRVPGEIGWVCPDALDVEAVARLQAQTLQMPLPWVFDWAGLQRVDAQAANALAGLVRQWSREPLDMRWLAGDRLQAVLQEAAPNGVRDADPAFWMLRLEVLRLADRADQFDEAAIDYCLTYEVSPPQWDRPKARMRIASGGDSTHGPSVLSEMSTGFLESSTLEDGQPLPTAHVELSGQLVGDIAGVLGELDGQLGGAGIVNVSCTRLIRVDFIAAGDLLNWVLAKRGENRQLHFVDAHRLVALFFGAMGINEHAKVRVRTV